MGGLHHGKSFIQSSFPLYSVFFLFSHVSCREAEREFIEKGSQSESQVFPWSHSLGFFLSTAPTPVCMFLAILCPGNPKVLGSEFIFNPLKGIIIISPLVELDFLTENQRWRHQRLQRTLLNKQGCSSTCSSYILTLTGFPLSVERLHPLSFKLSNIL